MSYVKEGGLRDAEEGDVCCVLVPGTNLQTFSLLPNRQGSAEVADWTKSSSAIGKLLASKFPRSKIICFMWPRSHHQKVRYEAATELTRVLNELRHKWRRIIVVGHSHGGNIAVQAAYKAPFARTELITLNTPFVMERQLTEEKIAPRIMIFF